MSFLNLSVLCHGRTISDDFVFPDSEWRARENRARELIDKNGLDGLLVFVEGAITRSNVCYLTNYHQFLSWGSALLIFQKNGESKLVSTVAPRDVTFMSKVLPDFVELIPVGLNLTSNEHVCVEAIKYMRENELIEGKKWGTVNLERMPQVAVDPWVEVYPEGMPDLTDDFGKIKAVKSENEIYALTAGSAIAKTCVMDYMRGAKAGENELTLAAWIDRDARMQGCESASLLTYAGKDGETMLRVPWDRNFEEGDTVSAFMNVSYLRYNGAYGATKVIGARTEEQDKLFAAAENLWEKKLSDMAADGKTVIGHVDGHCNKCDADYYTVVNGVGMDLVDYPCEVGEEAPLSDNMTLTVSLNVKKAGIGSVFKSANVVMKNGTLFSMSGFGKTLG